MLNNKRFILNILIAFGIVGVLSACGGGGGGDDGPVFNPDLPPYDMQVASGDGYNSDLSNTISWAYDPAATGHIVYWDKDPNGTFSNVVDGIGDSQHKTHVLPDSEAGSTYYYKVVATAGDQVSVPSKVVFGTPQLAISANSLNDVAWNGFLDGNISLVAVGDSGVILNSPNGTSDGWSLVDQSLTVESLSAVTWGNNQFVVVGANGTILTSPDGDNWTLVDWVDQPIDVSTDLEDVVWTRSGYIVVGKNNGIILSGNEDASEWTEVSIDIVIDSAITLEGVEVGNFTTDGGYTIVAVGTHATIITSQDGGENWELIDLSEFNIADNNALNDVTWDGMRFGVVGSDSTILSSPDGLDWDKHNPSIQDYSLEGAVQWNASWLPTDPILAAVGSNGTYIYAVDEDTGYYVPTGTNEQLEAIIWVDIPDDEDVNNPYVNNPYFLMVGHDGTVLTSQIILD